MAQQKRRNNVPGRHQENGEITPHCTLVVRHQVLQETLAIGKYSKFVSEKNQDVYIDYDPNFDKKKSDEEDYK